MPSALSTRRFKLAQEAFSVSGSFDHMEGTVPRTYVPSPRVRPMFLLQVRS
jgi:hypothetical protein